MCRIVGCSVLLIVIGVILVMLLLLRFMMNICSVGDVNEFGGLKLLWFEVKVILLLGIGIGLRLRML